MGGVNRAYFNVALYLLKMLSLILSFPGTSTIVRDVASSEADHSHVFSSMEFCVLK